MYQSLRPDRLVKRSPPAKESPAVDEVLQSLSLVRVTDDFYRLLLMNELQADLRDQEPSAKLYFSIL